MGGSSVAFVTLKNDPIFFSLIHATSWAITSTPNGESSSAAILKDIWHSKQTDKMFSFKILTNKSWRQEM